MLLYIGEQGSLFVGGSRRQKLSNCLASSAQNNEKLAPGEM